MDPGSLLSVKKLQVDLEGRALIQNLSFELQEKETLVILGPNGAGKTVLLRSLLGLIPHRGEVIWQKGVRVGFVPQRVPANRDLPMSVSDFFALKAVSKTQASELLKQVGLEEPSFLDRQLGFLSAGQFQRVLIAWALARNPQVLILDEPTAGVDVGGEDAIHTLLHKSRADRKFAVILVTHDLSTVYREASRVLCMNQQKFCYGPPRDVLDPAVLQDIYGRDLKFFEHSHD